MYSDASHGLLSHTGTEGLWISEAFICQSGTFQDLQKRQLKTATKKIKNGSIYMYLKTSIQTHEAPQVAPMVKNLPTKEGDIRDASLIPGLGRPPCRWQWQPTPVFLPGESQGQKSPVGYSPQSDLGHTFRPICVVLSATPLTHTELYNFVNTHVGTNEQRDICRGTVCTPMLEITQTHFLGRHSHSPSPSTR